MVKKKQFHVMTSRRVYLILSILVLSFVVFSPRVDETLSPIVLDQGGSTLWVYAVDEKGKLEPKVKLNNGHRDGLIESVELGQQATTSFIWLKSSLYLVFKEGESFKLIYEWQPWSKKPDVVKAFLASPDAKDPLNLADLEAVEDDFLSGLQLSNEFSISAYKFFLEEQNRQ